jgi:hypothetical protein
MNRQGIIKSVSTLFPTRWHSATRFGVHPVKFASRNELLNRINQVLISIIMASFCGINRINKISSFTGDGLTRVLLKPNKAINENAITTTLKKLGRRGARRLQSLLLLTNTRWLKESGLTSITLDAVQLHEIYKQRSTSETWIEQVKGQAMAGATLTNDNLWQFSVFAYNLTASWRVRQNKNKFWQQEHRTFIDWFVAVPAKITRSGHQMELKLYEHHFYKADWEEMDSFIEAA